MIFNVSRFVSFYTQSEIVSLLNVLAFLMWKTHLSTMVIKAKSDQKFEHHHSVLDLTEVSSAYHTYALNLSVAKEVLFKSRWAK